MPPPTLVLRLTINIKEQNSGGGNLIFQKKINAPMLVLSQ